MADIKTITVAGTQYNLADPVLHEDFDSATTGQAPVKNSSGGIDWTNFQSEISDLATIRSGAAKGATSLQSHQDISGKEDSSNKTTTLSSSSTDTQYPSAKAVYEAIAAAGGGSSDGGIIVSATEPSGDDTFLWVDTANGGISKYWNGTAWTTVKAVWG